MATQHPLSRFVDNVRIAAGQARIDRAALLAERDALRAENARLREFVKRVVSDAGASVCKDKATGEPRLCGGLNPAILMDEFYRHGRKALAEPVK